MSVKSDMAWMARRLASRLLPLEPQERAMLSLLSREDIARLSRTELENACRTLASPVYLGENTALCRVLGRYKIYTDTRDVTIVAHLLLEGYWESWLSQFMARYVKPGWTVADLGANYGYYTLLLADLVGPAGKVIAIEPNPDAATLCRRSVFLNGFGAWTDIHEVAASNTDEGMATLVVPRSMTGGAALTEVACFNYPDAINVEVPLTTLDTLLANEQHIDFMKIDVEASEERIIAGMEAIFARSRPAMVLEFNPARYRDAAGFLRHLTNLYGELREIDFSGHPSPVDAQRVLDTPTEWLLFLERP